jgi:hypothetical protein
MSFTLLLSHTRRKKPRVLWVVKFTYFSPEWARASSFTRFLGHIQRRTTFGRTPMVESGDRIPVGARFFALVQTSPGTQPASCTMGTGSLPRVNSGRGVTLTPYPLLVPWSRKGRAIPLLPYGPYGLYRASVPVQGYTLLVLYLWTSDQPVAETSTCQNTTLTTDRHPCPWWNSNQHSQQERGRRPGL